LTNEWSERRRLLVLGLCWMVYNFGYCLSYEFEYRTRALVASYYSGCMFYVWVASLLLSMSTATGEYSQRTLRFTASLPVSLSHAAWARLIAMWGCLVIPITINAMIATLVLGSGLIEQAGIRPENYGDQGYLSLPDRPSISKVDAIIFLWTTMAIATGSGLFLSTIISLFGTFCRREGTVGFIGVILILISLQFTSIRFDLDRGEYFFVSRWIGSVLPESMAIQWSYGERDGSSFEDLELAPLIVAPLAINLVMTLGLATLFSWRYGRRSEATAIAKQRWWWMPRLPRLTSRLPIRWPGRIAALTWLDLRQSVPLCLSGLIIAGIFTLLGLRSSHAYPTLEGRFIKQLPESTWFIGLIWASIVAVGVFGAEIKPGLAEFWRSRPIAPRTWFWTKFVIGLLALVTALDLLPALALWKIGYRPEPNTGYLGMGLKASLYCTPLLHAQVYSLTVAAICLLRRSIPAAILGLVLAFGTDRLLESVPTFPRLSTIDVLNELNQLELQKQPLDLYKVGYPLVYGIVATIIVVATLLARRTIVPPKSNTMGWGLLFLVVFTNLAPAQEAGSPLASEIIQGIKHRDEAIQDLRMRLSTNIHHTGNEPLTTGKSKRAQAVAARPYDESFIYEFFQKGKQRAWTKLGLDGTVQEKLGNDGTYRREYHPRGSSTASKQESILPFRYPHPFGLLCEQLNLSVSASLSELLTSHPLDSIERKDIDGEQFIEFTITKPAGRQEVQTENGSQVMDFMGHRLQMTVNVTRDCWPVKIIVHQLADASGRVSERDETNASGWIESGGIVFPRTVEQKIFKPRISAKESSADSPEFLETEVKRCEIVEIDVNNGIPDDVFSSVIPPGEGYYDTDTSKYLEIDESGLIKPHIPRPRGLRGATFAYMIVTLVAGLIYLYRRPTALQLQSAGSR
jgi:ABC-type transport system involved in multi-copper enzyme maturation permease subunit